MRNFSRGHRVIYYETTQASLSNSQARRLTSSAEGESAACIVKHFATVMESRKKGSLVLLTLRGDLIVTHKSCRNLRRAHWWERCLHRNQFPHLGVTKD